MPAQHCRFRNMRRTVPYRGGKLIGKQGCRLAGFYQKRTCELAAIGIVEPEIEPLAPRIDGDGEGPAVSDHPALQRRLGHHGERVGAPEVSAGGEGKAARRGDGDAHAGEAPWAQGGGDKIERWRSRGRLPSSPRPPWASGLGVAARHSLLAKDDALRRPRRREALRRCRRPCWCRGLGCSSGFR